ncbi:MAG: dihydropteroate synthase [Solirubrobacteraceae bacterium]
MAAYRLMGIVNVTPDSFSDGGLFLDSDAAIRHGLELVEQGASILDVGGESTRPGAEPVDAREESRRVVPVIEGLSNATRSMSLGPQISVDTSKAAVASAALKAGASLVNDVSALRADPDMAGVVADSGAECCLMHMLGEPRTMQRDPRYGDVVDDVKAFLEQRLAFAVAEGVAEQRILLDPGIGFGKTVAHNLELLRRLHELLELGRPIVIGTSRKSFLGRIAVAAQGGSEPMAPEERLSGTIATNVIALERGASVFRIHDVAAVAAALAVAAATLSGKWTATPTTS